MPDLSPGVAINIDFPTQEVIQVDRPPQALLEVDVIRGPRGLPGLPGTGASDAIEFVQSTPSASWGITVPPEMGRTPSVTVYDDSGKLVLADVQANSSTVNITFPSPTSGLAILT